MRLHIAGICGTFMGGLALLARSLGHEVSGSDANVYPPMSTQLRTQGIRLREGYDPAHLDDPDLVIVGNALSRGNPLVEAVLDRGLPYTSGAQWLADAVLGGRWVLAVAGTHGKTTTASMLAWILEDAGLSPGFLIGGVPANFGVSARLGETPFFVVEADEYDTAFFDKRSKFVHYRPRTLVLNNLEFDHADIFPDLAAIQTQFHHLLRTVPGSGKVVVNGADAALAEVLERGCWTPREVFFPPGVPAGAGEAPRWTARLEDEAGGRFQILLDDRPRGEVDWSLIGAFNAANALAAVAAARHAGVPVAAAAQALGRFRPVRRRMELRGTARGVAVYDDFAHHPTAIRASLEALRRARPGRRLVAVLEPRSNTMRMGVHRHRLAQALAPADRIRLYAPPDLQWDIRALPAELDGRARVFDDIGELVRHLAGELEQGDQVLIMSNGAFGGIHERLLGALGA